MNMSFDLSKFFATSTIEKKTNVLLELCKRDPELLLELIKKSAKVSTWEADAEASLRSGRKIDAIKHCRSATGWTLRASKSAVEALQVEMGIKFDR